MTGTPATKPGGNEAARRLAHAIAEERRKMGVLAISDLHSLDVIRRIANLERMINEYTRITCAKK